jgi:hypothetical protein
MPDFPAGNYAGASSNIYSKKDCCPVDYLYPCSLLPQKDSQQGKRGKSMPKYMLLLRDDRELFGKLGPEEMQKTIEKYYAWRSKPFVVDGAGLMEKTGRVMQKKNGSVSVTAGPYSESREVMGGYYTIEAANFDEAVKLASDNPHVNFGTIEIREVAHRAA